MRTPQLGLLALLGLFIFSCASPLGTDPAGAPRKRAATPAPKAEGTAAPGPQASATPAPEPGATEAPDPTATDAASDDYFALVKDAEGRPVNGATVRVYMPEGLAPIKSATTDARGRFSLPGLAVWPVHLEVVGPLSGKVYQTDVRKETQRLQLTLAPPGTITGQVKAPSLAAAPDFSDVTVRVVGTSYSTQAATDGAYVLEGVPAGAFELVAQGPLLGAATPVQVEVAAGGAPLAPDLVVAPSAPMIGSLTPDHGGPGAMVTIHGTGFGREASGAIAVRFGDAAAASAQRVSDTEIRAAVPASAANGHVVVTLGGKLPSAGKAFRVLKRIHVAASDASLTVGQTATVVAEAFDSAEAVVTAPALSAWTSSAPAVASVDAQGNVSAVSAGTAILSIGSGTLQATQSITVVAP